MTKKVLVINIIFSQAILLFIGFLLSYFFLDSTVLIDSFKIKFQSGILTTFLLGSLALLFLQVFFHKYFSADSLFDELNLLLIETLSLPNLFVVFFSGSFVEELLFRGILQHFWGIWITSLVFALIHFRYLNKPILFVEVYAMGVILGLSYQVTLSLWVPIFCHLTVNFLTALLMKKGFLEYKL